MANCLTPSVAFDVQALAMHATMFLGTVMLIFAAVVGNPKDTLVVDRQGVFLFVGLMLLVGYGMMISMALQRAGCV
jgi:hypothetical protein